MSHSLAVRSSHYYETIDASGAEQISEAIMIWIGRVPALDYDREAALVERFGAQVATKLVPILSALDDDFHSTNAGDVADDLREMHRLAFDDFKRKHPEISDHAVHALAAKYTYANR